MIRRIDHVALAVKDLEAAKKFFIDKLGGRELFNMAYVPQKFRWTTVEFGQSCFIEILDSLEEGGFVDRFLKNKGEGLNHITIQVESISAIRELLEEKEIPTFGYSEDLPGWKEIFIHPKHAFGVLIQFAEFDPLRWINPGFVPESYRQFAPPTEPGEIEVRRLETDDGPIIEVRQKSGVVYLAADQADKLARQLTEAAQKG